MRDHNDKKDLALEAVLLFHQGGPWLPDKRIRWQAICNSVLGTTDYANENHQGKTGGWDATTRTLCDIVRAAKEV